MKKLLFLFAVTLTYRTLLAEPTNAVPARLALIGREAALQPAMDLLTAELSRNERIALLERAEIERVFREQSLSAAGRDYLKLGQVLGADGLLIAGTFKDGTNEFLGVRLVAVKPGAVIGAVRSVWPIADVAQWAKGLSVHFAPLFPKLNVLAKDAVPLSVVNLRSAVSSRKARELEQQLTVLAIERLTREREVFVLERQRMELLSAEKEFRGLTDSPFWNGSYLLEGVIDRDGYSKERVTIHARLVPPAGGAPIELVVEAPQEQLSVVVERLAERILLSLKRTSSLAAWQPEAEAQKYFDEARWALKWGILPQAKAASEAAWALGKRDVDCAIARLRAYLPDVPPDTSGIETGTAYGSGVTPRETLRELAATRPIALLLDERTEGTTRTIKYLAVHRLPDPKYLDRAVHALGLYADFLQSSPAEEPKAGSPWYQAGIDALTAASQVLEYFHLVADAAQDSRAKLAELRALARSVAERITRSPSVRDSFWVGERLASHDELAHTMAEAAHIFRCKLDWGCFWQDKPEDCPGVYRELLSSPVFCYFHQGFWFRELSRPRVSAWTAEDKTRVPLVWKSFLEELNASTNFLWRMEAKALEFADAKNDQEQETAFEALFGILLSNREAMVTCNVELPYLGWGLRALVDRDGIVSPTREKLQRSDRFRQLDAMRDEWWTRSREASAARAQAAGLEKQKEYLKANTPYDFFKFSQVFGATQYSPAQAQELAPLLASYKSNLLARTQSKNGSEVANARAALARLSLVEASVQRGLNPPAASPPKVAAAPPTTPPPLAAKARVASPPSQPAKTVVATNALLVKRFVQIPLDRLKENQPDESFSEISVVAHRFVAGRLWLDCRFKHNYAEYFPNGMRWINNQREAAAVLNPKNDTWELIAYPEPKVPPNRLPVEYFEVAPDALYVSGWEYLRRYDLQTRRWETLAAPWQLPARLFLVHQRLFAATGDAIFELRDGGRTVSNLASCRRRPAVSALDSLESLGSPVVFPGPDNSIRASAAGKIFSWNGQDWSDLPGVPGERAEVFTDAAIVFGNTGFGQNTTLWLLAHSQTNADLCLRDERKDTSVYPGGGFPSAKPKPAEPPTRWKNARGIQLSSAPSLTADGNLFFFVEHFAETNINGRPAATELEGRHADLICFDRDCAARLAVPLRFDPERGPVPGAVLDRGRPGMFEARNWMALTPDALCVGRGSLPGVWLIPKRALEESFQGQKASQLESSRQESVAAERLQKSLLEKYDRDRNGKIEGVERGAALGDSAYLELELPVIDADHNGRLDPKELAWFDANKNSVLENDEQSGVELCLRLLAGKQMKEFDNDEDSQLSRAEFSAAWPAEGVALPGYLAQDFARADGNHDGKVDLEELASFFKERTQRALRLRPSPGLPFNPAMMARTNSPTTFKQAVEAYWRGGAGTNRPSPGPNALPSRPPTQP